MIFIELFLINHISLHLQHDDFYKIIYTVYVIVVALYLIIFFQMDRIKRMLKRSSSQFVWFVWINQSAFLKKKFLVSVQLRVQNHWNKCCLVAVPLKTVWIGGLIRSARCFSLFFCFVFNMFWFFIKGIWRRQNILSGVFSFIVTLLPACFSFFPCPKYN